MKFNVPSRGNGPRSHLPVAIVIDKSTSTQDIRELLNSCIIKLLNNMKNEATLRNTVDLLVIHYSSDIEVILDFERMEKADPEKLMIRESKGFTHTGGALLNALHRLDEKKAEWKYRVEKYYQPMMFLLTDGYPDAGIGAPEEVVRVVKESYNVAAAEIKKREKEEKLVFIAAGIEQVNGEKADMKTLSELSIHPERILRVREDARINEIDRFFQLIYESTNATFSNTPVDDVINEIWSVFTKV